MQPSQWPCLFTLCRSPAEVDDDGINSLQIDDSETGLRKRFTIWVAAFSVVAGAVYSR